MRNRTLQNKAETSEEKLRHVCRCGAGVEANFMKCDTPGFPLRNEPGILRDLRGLDRVDLPRNNRRITQSSEYLMRGWRGNCDIQLLVYQSAPKDVDASDIARVTNYVVSYACKGSESSVEEKKNIVAIINSANDQEGDCRDVKRLARRVLNECSKNRVISKQEAICQLAGLPLYTCSEILERVSVSGNARLGTEYEGRSTFLSRYANRHDHENMSLDQYYHYVYNDNLSTNRADRKVKIPVYSGAQCEAVYPATAAYAHGIMLLHCPWKKIFPFEKDGPHLLDEFHKFVSDGSRCPDSV